MGLISIGFITRPVNIDVLLPTLSCSVKHFCINKIYTKIPITYLETVAVKIFLYKHVNQFTTRQCFTIITRKETHFYQ